MLIFFLTSISRTLLHSLMTSSYSFDLSLTAAILSTHGTSTARTLRKLKLTFLIINKTKYFVLRQYD